jgi:hypothetical protein
MDQDPLPRGSFQMTDRLAQVPNVVRVLTRAAVAVEAKNATYVTEHMIVVNMLGVGHAADCADAALLGQKLLKLLLTDAVATPQVVFAGTAVQAHRALAPTHVMTRLAVTAEAGSAVTVARKVLEWRAAATFAAWAAHVATEVGQPLPLTAIPTTA